MGLGCSRREKQRTVGAGRAGNDVRCRAMPPRCLTDGCDRLQNVSSRHCCTVCARGDAARLGHTRPCEDRVDRVWSVLKDPQPAGGAALGRRLGANEQRVDRPAGDPPSLFMKVPWSPMNIITISMDSYDIHMNFYWFGVKPMFVLGDKRICASVANQ